MTRDDIRTHLENDFAEKSQVVHMNKVEGEELDTLIDEIVQSVSVLLMQQSQSVEGLFNPDEDEQDFAVIWN